MHLITAEVSFALAGIQEFQYPLSSCYKVETESVVGAWEVFWCPQIPQIEN